MAASSRPVFIYGTLCAKPLLAWVLTGDATNVKEISTLIRPAKVDGVARYSVYGSDYPAVVMEDGTSTNGYVLQPQTSSQRKKLENFEGEVYKIEACQAILRDRGELIEADIYVWDGQRDLISDAPWCLEWFIEKRLEDWIDLFAGMELVGEDDG